MDKYNLRQVIIDYPNQLAIGKKFADKVSLNFKNKKYKNIIVCGMGGSALPGEFLKNYIEYEKRKNLPVFICRDYRLPVFAKKNSLILISSYSGNTEETLSCFEEALEKKFDIIAFSAGGKIEKIAKKNKLPYIKYNIKFDHLEPRYATTYAFMAMFQVLTKLKLFDTIEFLPKIDSKKFEVYGEEIAKKIKGKTPIIYSSFRNKPLALNWKIKINENGKTPAFWNCFPELNHNEMVGFSLNNEKFFILILKDKKDHKRILQRMKITTEIYKKLGMEVEIIELEGENYLTKNLNTLVLGDWISYYLALEYNQDPSPVELVEEFKKKLN